MDLYLMRHGKAEAAGSTAGDASRRLTRKGRDEIRSIAGWMKAQDLAFDPVAASPLIRAQETAEIISEVLGIQVETWDVLAPGGCTDDVCHAIRRYPQDTALLLVGHEPLLSALLGRIVCGDEDCRVAMTKGAVAKIRDLTVVPGCAGELHWLLTARQMTASPP